MLNYLWGFMILLGLGAGIVTGQVEAVSNASIDSAGEAVTMAITMLGIMSMWTGLIEVARQAHGSDDKRTAAGACVSVSKDTQASSGAGIPDGKYSC